ncbi:MAG: shikimate kinase [Bacteroidia bacterium]|nr:shikimate kinase [Bacteroidia bacterium]
MKIFLTGFMGCGKTSAGKILSKKINIPFIDLDQYIENTTNLSVSRIFLQQGESRFRETERSVLEKIISIENGIIATGGGTPCYQNNMELMNTAGTTIYIKRSISFLLEKLAEDNKNRPLLKGKTKPQILNYINEILPAREPYYLMSKIIIDTEESNAEKIAGLIYQQFLINP